MRFFREMIIFAAALGVFTFVGCSTTPESKLEDVRDRLRKGEYDRAKRTVDELVVADSASPEAICGTGYIEEYRGFEWDALIKYLEAAKLEDGHLPSMEAFTRIAIDGEYFDNARRMADILTQFQPENPRWYLTLSEIDVHQEKFADAARNIEIADSLGAGAADLALARARSAFYSYDPDAIDRAFQLLSQTSLTTADQYDRLASLYRYMNMLDSAIAAQRRAVDKASNNIGYRLRLAQYLCDQLHLSEAYDIIGPMIEEHENYGPARVLAGYVLWKMGKPVLGDRHFTTYIQFKDNAPVALEKHGDYYAHFDKTHLAQAEYMAAYTLAANLAYADEYLQRLYVKMENSFFEDKYLPMAIDYFEEGKRLLGSSLEMYFFEAELHGSFAETMDTARMMVDDRLDKNWHDREWLDLASRYYHRRNEFDRAAKVYRRLLELDYPKEIYFSSLLEIYERNKNRLAADTLARRLPLRFRNSRGLREKFYDVYMACGQTEQATAYAELLHENSPGYLPYILNLADLYSRQDRVDAARQLFVDYISDHSEDPEGHYRLARFELNHGLTDSILARIERTLELDSAYAYAYELKGMYYHQAGNPDSAFAAYHTAVGFSWPTPEAYYYLADYYYRRGDSLTYAAGLAMAAARYFENDKRGYQLLGDIYYAQGKYKMARLQYYKGQRMFPDDPELLFLLGRSHIKIDAPDDARKFLRQAIDKGLTEPQLSEARELLANL